MIGDEERELWFDRAGRIVKVEFRRMGADIAYVRDQLKPLEPEASSPIVLTGVSPIPSALGHVRPRHVDRGPMEDRRRRAESGRA